MASRTSDGAVISDDEAWYWSGWKWAPLVPNPSTKAPGLLSRERRTLAPLAKGANLGDLKRAGAELAEKIAGGASLEEALRAPRARRGGAASPREVQVKKYRSEKEFQRDAEAMFRGGWNIEGQSTRTKKWSATTGFFTNKGISTVTWLRGGEDPASEPPPAITPPEDVPAKLKQLAELRDAGVVSPEEFEAKKAELLSRM